MYGHTTGKTHLEVSARRVVGFVVEELGNSTSIASFSLAGLDGESLRA